MHDGSGGAAGKLIDEVNGQSQGESAHKARQSLNESTWVLLVILLAGSVFTFIRGTLFNMAGERLVGEQRHDGSRLHNVACCVAQPAALTHSLWVTLASA